MKEAYYEDNSPSLRQWLREKGLTPIDYPDSDGYGITAPYPNCMGEMIMYNDGIRFDDDDDMENCIICRSEEEFKEEVLKLINK